eukprot:5237295-Prymnesium_polylepis.1
MAHARPCANERGCPMCFSQFVDRVPHMAHAHSMTERLWYVAVGIEKSRQRRGDVTTLRRTASAVWTRRQVECPEAPVLGLRMLPAPS